MECVESLLDDPDFMKEFNQSRKNYQTQDNAADDEDYFENEDDELNNDEKMNLLSRINYDQYEIQ